MFYFNAYAFDFFRENIFCFFFRRKFFVGKVLIFRKCWNFRDTQKFQKKIGKFYPTKKKSAKKSQQNIFSKKIKSICIEVKHIQRRASNSFWALRTTCLKLGKKRDLFGQKTRPSLVPYWYHSNFFLLYGNWGSPISESFCVPGTGLQAHLQVCILVA